MSREPKNRAVREPSLVASNEVLALAWLREFETSKPFVALAAPVQKSLAGAVRVMSYSFTRRWSRANETAYPLNEMTADDATDLLTEQLPRRVTAIDAEVIIDGLIEFLVWATKTHKIQNREVEYACRKSRHDAVAAMRDEHKWAPGKAIVLHALQDGVDATDLDRIRAHAMGRGLAPTFVDEFLPPGPTFLGNGRWLWQNE